MGVGDFLSLAAWKSLFAFVGYCSVGWCPLAAPLRVPDYIGIPLNQKAPDSRRVLFCYEARTAPEQVIDDDTRASVSTILGDR